MQNTHAEVQRLQTKLQSLGQQRRQTRQPIGMQAPMAAAGSEVSLTTAAAAPDRGQAVMTTAGGNQNQSSQLISLPFGASPSRHQEEPLSTDDLASVQEARQLARALRRRQHGTSPSDASALQTGTAYLLRFGKRLGRSFDAPIRTQPSRAARNNATPNATTAAASTPQSTEALSDITLQDALLWIAASAAVRVGLDLLLMTYASLWWPVVTLIIAPAAIALYRATVNPKAGFILGRQLLLIMIGLLIGGRML